MSIVVECPKGVFTRLMKGRRALELYELAKGPNGKKGTKQKPSFADQFVHHMTELERKYQKEIGNVATNR